MKKLCSINVHRSGDNHRRFTARTRQEPKKTEMATQCWHFYSGMPGRKAFFECVP